MAKKFNPNDDWLEIADINAFSDYIRNVVYINFKDEDFQDDEITDTEWNIDLNAELDNISKTDMEEMDSILDKDETLVIIKSDCKKIRHKQTKEVKYVMNDNMLYKMIEHVNQRMVSNIISKLVSGGLLESAFDDERNEFIFWKKEDKDNGNSQTDKF